RVDDREIEPDLVEALVEQPREYRSREIAGVLRGMAPEQLLADAAAPALLDRHRQHPADATADRGPAGDRLVAADLAELLGKDRAVFDPMPVGVDDRMVEARFDLCGSRMGAHRGTSGNDLPATVVLRRRRRKPARHRRGALCSHWPEAGRCG